jgi:hypothetical protein
MKNNLAKTGPSGVNLKTRSPLRHYRLNLLLSFSIALVFAFTAVPAGADEGTVISVASGTDWTNALARISAGENGTSTDPNVYTLDIQGEVSVPGISSPSISGSYKTVRLTGSGTLALSSSGSIFRIGGNQRLIIDGPTLKGRKDNNASLVYAGAGGFMELRNGNIGGNSANNENSDSFVCGVYVSGGAFNMSGGTISGNSSARGSGVYISGEFFYMSGGTISGNSFTYGSGVYISDGAFKMVGGTISGNSVATGAGGVYIGGGYFYLTDGTISGNSAATGAGGVSAEGGFFYMSDGTISGNSAATGAGGVSVVSVGAFQMSGGTISGNSVATGAGGVSVEGGFFYMSDGTISDNSAATGAGGVSVVSVGAFQMSGGTISGNVANTGTGGVSVTRGKSVKTGDGEIFIKTGGIIYGDTDNFSGNGNTTDNTAASNTNAGKNGNAMSFRDYNSGNGGYDYYYRNETLGNDANGNISTKAELLPAKSGETLNGWTMR